MKIKLGTGTEIKLAGIKTISAKDIQIAVLFHHEKFYAFNRACPHANGDLTKGRFEQGFVTCLNHGLKFDLHDGSIVIQDIDEDLTEYIGMDVLKKFKLMTYPIIQSNDELFIDL